MRQALAFQQARNVLSTIRIPENTAGVAGNVVSIIAVMHAIVCKSANGARMVIINVATQALAAVTTAAIQVAVKTSMRP